MAIRLDPVSTLGTGHIEFHIEFILDAYSHFPLMNPALPCISNAKPPKTKVALRNNINTLGDKVCYGEKTGKASNVASSTNVKSKMHDMCQAIIYCLYLCQLYELGVWFPMKSNVWSIENYRMLEDPILSVDAQT